GQPLAERASETIASVGELFRVHWPTSATVYLPNNAVPAPAAIFANPALARTYVRILAEAESAGHDRVAQIERARAAWSRGFVADAIDRFCRTQAVMDVSGEPHRGALTGADMAAWQPSLESPLTHRHRPHTVCQARPLAP